MTNKKQRIKSLTSSLPLISPIYTPETSFEFANVPFFSPMSLFYSFKAHSYFFYVLASAFCKSTEYRALSFLRRRRRSSAMRDWARFIVLELSLFSLLLLPFAALGS